jgi:hypothetical protein
MSPVDRIPVGGSTLTYEWAAAQHEPAAGAGQLIPLHHYDVTGPLHPGHTCWRPTGGEQRPARSAAR